MSDTNNNTNSKKNGFDSSKIDVQSVYASGDANANTVLDLVESAEASTELLNQVENEVNEMDAKVQALEQLYAAANNLTTEEIAAMTNLMTSASLKNELQNAPLSNEAKDAIAQDQAEKMAEALIASDNARHPIRFAFEQMGASLQVVRNIPAQMRDNIQVAQAAGLDCNTALQNASHAICAKTTDAYNATKSCISRTATKVATGATELYNKAVENTVSAWEKGKVKMENFVHKSTKAFDIGMEAITLGGWSRFCTNAAIRADIANHNGNYDYNKKLRTANEKGFEGGRELFGANLDNNKLVNATEKAKNFLATAFTKFHGKMEGLDTNKGLTNEGRVDRNNQFISYWKDVKGTVWEKGSDVRENASNIKGNFDATSPMDVLAGKTKELTMDAAKMYKSADEKMHKGIDAVKEAPKKVAEGTKSFFTNLGGKIKSGFNKAVNVVCDTARNVAAEAVELGGKGTALFLKGVSGLCKKARDFDNSQVKNFELIENVLKKDVSSAEQKIAKAENSLNDIKSQKVEAKVEIPNELVEAKAILEAAHPTANISKAITKIEKEEKDLMNKANRQAKLHNAGVNLKNAGVIISDKVQIAYYENAIKKANNELSATNKEKNFVDKEAKMFNRWSGTVDKGAETVKTKAKDLADKIRGKGYDGGGGDGKDDAAKGETTPTNTNSKYEKKEENIDDIKLGDNVPQENSNKTNATPNNNLNQMDVTAEVSGMDRD